MRGNTLSNQLLGIELPKKISTSLQYQQIIAHQNTVIKLLQKQIAHLRRYLHYYTDYKQINELCMENKVFEELSIDQKKCGNNQLRNSAGNGQFMRGNQCVGNVGIGMRGLIEEVVRITGTKNCGEAVKKLRDMQEKANKKIQPLFIEKIKQKQVPVIVQIQKPIIIQKIIYQDKKSDIYLFDQTQKNLYSNLSLQNPEIDKSSNQLKIRKKDIWQPPQIPQIPQIHKNKQNLKKNNCEMRRQGDQKSGKHWGGWDRWCMNRKNKL